MTDAAGLWGTEELVTLSEILDAQSILKNCPDVLRTPTLVSWPVAETRISLKLESLQMTGSFKIRGMRYKLHTSNIDQLKRSGVVTLSAGNAGKAVSYLARSLGINAKVFMPATAPDDRKEMMESMGAIVIKVSTNNVTFIATCNK
jgi:threonine dehydratase